MLHIITQLTDPLLGYVRDDPVRPEIPAEFRVATNRFVAVLVEEKPQAMVCVSLQQSLPQTVAELGDTAADPIYAVFYTIWSYAPGAGANLLINSLSFIREQYPTVERFVTLSPLTDMARRFHLRNGATVLQTNPETVNYEYRIK